MAKKLSGIHPTRLSQFSHRTWFPHTEVRMFHFSQAVLWLHSDAIPAGDGRGRYRSTSRRQWSMTIWLVGGVGSTGVLRDPRRFRVTMVTKSWWWDRTILPKLLFHSVVHVTSWSRDWNYQCTGGNIYTRKKVDVIPCGHSLASHHCIQAI